MDEWGKVKVSDVCEILDNMRVPITASERKAGIYPYYGANGIQDYVDDFIFDDELVLLAEDGGHFGSKTKPIAYRVSGKCWINNHAHVLKPRESMNVDYLCYAIMFYDVLPLISGTTRAKLNKRAIEKMIISKPPLEVQKQIAEALAEANLLIEKRKLQIEKLDLLIKSQFVEMFGNPAVNSKKWEEKKLKECLVNIESGKSFVCDSKRRTGNNVAMLKLSAVTYGKYDSTENKAILEEKMFVSKAEVKKGDLLFTRKNTPELVGMSAFVYSTPPKLMMPDLIFRLNTNEKCNRVYLWTLINLDEFRHRVTGLASGSAKSMSNISKERLSNLVLPVPPIELQTQFADFVNKVEKTKATLQQSLTKMEQNYKSLMQKCFRGEIF